MRGRNGSPLILFLFFFLSSFADASDTSFEKDLQGQFEESERIVVKAIEKIGPGASFSDDIARLKTKAGQIRATYVLLQERFSLIDEDVKTKGQKAQDRQRRMSEGFRQALEEYLSLIDSLPPDGSASQTDLENIKSFFDRLIHRKKRPLIGSLPYRNLNYPSRVPSTDPPIKPAYKGGNKVISPDDTKSTEEAPISEGIATLAQSLKWDPVSIYEYVKDNVETEWYRGCMKGAEETLSQKSGNDCDQATLLVALLRASGFPSRYVRGTIEFFAGGKNGIPMERVRNLTGIDDPWKIAEFFQKAGIPFTPVITAGAISNFQIEHIWVESQIPYANYRGAIIDNQGKTWLGLDTSIKPKGYTYSQPIDTLAEFSLPDVRDGYLSTLQTRTPLEYTKTEIGSYLSQKYADKTYNDLLSSRAIIPEDMKILPASMQFYQRNITHEYTQIPSGCPIRVLYGGTCGTRRMRPWFDSRVLPRSGLRILEDSSWISHSYLTGRTVRRAPARYMRATPPAYRDGNCKQWWQWRGMTLMRPIVRISDGSTGTFRILRGPLTQANTGSATRPALSHP